MSTDPIIPIDPSVPAEGPKPPTPQQRRRTRRHPGLAQQTDALQQLRATERQTQIDAGVPPYKLRYSLTPGQRPRRSRRGWRVGTFTALLQSHCGRAFEGRASRRFDVTTDPEEPSIR